MVSDAQVKAKELDALRKKRGTDKGGIVKERIQILTAKQVRERAEALQKGQAPSSKPGAVTRKNNEVDPTDTQIAKITKYL
jgi:hypothetical protein